MKKLYYLLIIILFFSGCIKKPDEISKNDMELQEKSPFFIDLTQVENYKKIRQKRQFFKSIFLFKKKFRSSISHKRFYIQSHANQYSKKHFKYPK